MLQFSVNTIHERDLNFMDLVLSAMEQKFITRRTIGRSI